jgi:NADH-quinone oxidoreductase subunit K
MSKYLILSSMLFIIGLLGLFLSRQTHLIIILMALEIILLSANINFVIFSIYFDDMLGQIYSLLVLTIGAVESAIGLAILIVYYRLRGSIAVDMIYTLKG